jgi:hypothetical protein
MNIKIIEPEDLKADSEYFERLIHEELVTYDSLPADQELNEYIEFIFNLLLELIALLDMSGDIVLLIALYNSEHTAWFTLSLLSMLSPFFVCYVPLLTF